MEPTATDRQLELPGWDAPHEERFWIFYYFISIISIIIRERQKGREGISKQETGRECILPLLVDGLNDQSPHLIDTS